jgi:two-component sensor histidine kinase
MDRARLKEIFSWKHRWVRWGVGFVVWTLLGVSFAIRSYLTGLQNNSNPSWKATLSAFLTDFYLWGLVSPLIFLLARRFELWRHFPRNVLIHVVSSLVFSTVVLMLTGPVYWYVGYPNLARTPTMYSLFRVIVFSPYYFHTAITIYWTTLIVAHASQYYRGLREEETRAARLATQLAQAQLRALEMQIHPHFLFNTLNSISALLHQDVEAADRMIAQLGSFLRLTLGRSIDQTIPFAQELEFLSCYLEIERTRFHDRLMVDMDVEPRALEVKVPNLILQPIVENAIRHGVARQTTAGRISIRAFREQDRLIMQVADNGPGLETNGGSNSSSGIGLSNVKARLGQCYGNDYQMDVANGEGRGVIVTVDIPATNRTTNEGQVT